MPQSKRNASSRSFISSDSLYIDASPGSRDIDIHVHDDVTIDWQSVAGDIHSLDTLASRYESSSILQRIDDLINRERKYIEKVTLILDNSFNSTMHQTTIEAAKQNLLEAKRNLAFLEVEKDRISSSCIDLNDDDNSSSLDHFKSKYPLSRQKILSKIPLIFERLAYETKLLDDLLQIAKQDHSLHININSIQDSLNSDTEILAKKDDLCTTVGPFHMEKIEFTRSKIRILKQSMKKYEQLNLMRIEQLDTNSTLSPPSLPQNQKNAFQDVQSGRLVFTQLALSGSIFASIPIRSLVSKGGKFSKAQVFLEFYVDNSLVSRTRSKPKIKRHKSLDIDNVSSNSSTLDDTNDEDYQEQSGSMRLTWAESIDFAFEKASRLEIIALVDTRTILGLISIPICFITTDDQVSKDELLSLELEPYGYLSTHITFQPSESLLSSVREHKLKRQKAIKRSCKSILGHAFVPSNHFGPTKCAICTEWIWHGSIRCQLCIFRCHKACMNKCSTPCYYAKSKGHFGSYTGLLVHVPHEWIIPIELNPFTSFCMHCGQNKANITCRACNSIYHDTCKRYVPPFCGVPPDILSMLRIQTESANNVQQELKEFVKKTLPPLEILPIVVKNTKQEQSLPSGSSYTMSDFVLVSLLGKGNFGKVYLARDKKHNGRLIALKILQKSYILEHDEADSLENEKKVFTKIANKHPFLIHMYGCFQTKDLVVFVIEYVPGGDLMHHIQLGSFGLEQAKFYSAQILLALEHLHNEHDVIYRDLKLDNILLCSDGYIKLADYGLCKHGMKWDTTTGTFCGTPEFMAPEVIKGEKYTKSVDWWAFGVLLYELLLSSSPFFGKNEEEIFQSILKCNPVYPWNLDLNATSLMKKLLVLDPKQRMGYGKEGSKQIKAHPFYHDINFDLLYKKESRLNRFLVPKITSEADVCNFDKEFTREAIDFVQEKDDKDDGPVIAAALDMEKKPENDCFKDFDCIVYSTGHIKSMSVKNDNYIVKQHTFHRSSKSTPFSFN